MPDATSPSPRAAHLRGLTRLGFDAVAGVTDIVEQLHRTISDRAAPLGAPGAARTRGLTGAVYGTVRGTTRLAARGVDAALRAYGSVAAAAAPAPRAPRREAALAALNGVWGDHLHATGNPLAIPMSLRVQGRPLALDGPSLRDALPEGGRRVAVLLHGLCMNDLQWQRAGHHHGELLQRDCGQTVLALHYNSGRHVADNGLQLAALLESLVAHWPGALDELSLVGHSMGGLVARSACHAAGQQGLHWPQRLARLVCLGTPHQGALLERGGHQLDRLLELSPYAAPFARLGQARSAGITDLRYGHVQHPGPGASAGAEGRPPRAPRHDDRPPTPLPRGVDVYLLAATLSERPEGLRHALVGDGLVTLASAWGEHRDRALALAVPRSHKALITGASHWDLLSHPAAADRLRHWFG